MPRQVATPTNEQRLNRVLAGLETELLGASDAEVRLAAGDIGINPDMKGSIAWLGILFPKKFRGGEVFDLDALRRFMRQRLGSPGSEDD